MTSDLTCPECGERLPADAPRGHCPACLLRVGLLGDISEALDLVEVIGSFLGPGPWRDSGGALEGSGPLGLSGEREVGGGPGSREVVTRAHYLALAL